AHRTRMTRGGTCGGSPRTSTAERAGFEPAMDLSAHTRFPVALLRPLGHLSEKGQGGGRQAEAPRSRAAWERRRKSDASGPLGHLSRREQGYRAANEGPP